MVKTIFEIIKKSLFKKSFTWNVIPYSCAISITIPRVLAGSGFDLSGGVDFVNVGRGLEKC